MPLVYKIAHQYKRQFPTLIEYDDLVADGMYGAILAVDRYDPERGDLNTFAYLRIKGQIMDSQRAREGRFYDGVTNSLNTNAISLDSAVGDLESSTMTLADLLPDDEDSITKMVDLLTIRDGLDALPDRPARVLWLYYFEDMNLKDIGAQYGVSESRASQLLTAARIKLYRVLTGDGTEDIR